MQYPAALRNTQPLRVAYRGGSSVDTLIAAAPPLHSSRRERTNSEVPAEHGTGQDDLGSDEDDQHSSPSLSMHSFPDDDSDEAFPSPHSAEDLRGTDDRRTDGGTYGGDSSTALAYVFLPSQSQTDSSFTTSTPPPASDTQEESQNSAVHLTSGTFSAPPTPSPYSHETHTRYVARHYSTPTSPSASVGALARSSPPPTMYRHTPLSQPAGIGQMTYRHHRTNTEVYHDPNNDILSDDRHANRSHTLPMASTATFLPEDANSQTRSQVTLPVTGSSHRQQSSSATQKSTTSTIIAPLTAPGRATNFVSLSRKSTIKKAGFFRHATVPSSITGKFTIDPSLHISSALLKALETPSTLVSATYPGMRPKGAPAKARTKNLQLEVENGGIDIDIHLIPPPRDYMTRRMTVTSVPASDARPPLARAATLTAPSKVPVEKPPFEKPPFMSEESYARSGFANKRPSPLGRHSMDTQLPFVYQSTPPPAPSPPPVRKVVPSGALPTLIDLRLKEVKNGKSRKDSGPKKGKEFALVARIHAPNPRPPFHLLASTVDIIPYTPSALGNAGIPPPDPNAKSKKPFTRPPRHAAPVPYSRSQSRSPLTLHLPRTFRGPLTVNISDGNIDAHVRLSAGVAEASVVLAESAYSRGYFVGRLAPDEERRDLKKMGSTTEWTFIDRQGVEAGSDTVHANVNESGEKRSAGEGTSEGDAESKQDDGENQEEEEWAGDKIDVFVGSGKVFLQLLGEEDPFGKKGFWSRVMGL